MLITGSSGLIGAVEVKSVESEARREPAQPDLSGTSTTLAVAEVARRVPDAHVAAAYWPPETTWMELQPLVLTLAVQFRQGLSGAELTAAGDRLEQTIRAQYLHIKYIFIEANALVKAAPHNEDDIGFELEQLAHEIG